MQGTWEVKKCCKLKYCQTFAQRPGYHFCVYMCVWLSFISLFVVVQLLSPVWLLVIPRTATHQAFLSFTISRSLHKFMSIKLVMPTNHLILCCPLLLLPSIFPSIRVFSNKSAFCIRWPKYWSFSFSNSPSDEYSGLISFRIDWFDLLAVQRTLKSLLQHHNLKASVVWCLAFFMIYYFTYLPIFYIFWVRAVSPTV